MPEAFSAFAWPFLDEAVIIPSPDDLMCGVIVRLNVLRYKRNGPIAFTPIEIFHVKNRFGGACRQAPEVP
jgi:hypothetical protein